MTSLFPSAPGVHVSSFAANSASSICSPALGGNIKLKALAVKPLCTREPLVPPALSLTARAIADD
jgi:hypothetical protein